MFILGDINVQERIPFKNKRKFHLKIKILFQEFFLDTTALNYLNIFIYKV